MNNIEFQFENPDVQEKEPYVGMPVTILNRCYEYPNRDPLEGMPLAMAYVPWQRFCETYAPAEALKRGTIFPELDLPFLGGGGC